MQFDEAEREELETNLREAQANFDQNPDDLDSIIWLGRRLAYLWRYKDAIAVYTQGIQKYPDEPRLYRHRGHRYITVRQFDKAVEDLSRAADLIKGKPDRIEIDGAPNPRNIPRSTLHSNVWYHLALAHYLEGHFEAARDAWRECMKVSDNDDMLVATTDWLYMTLRRLGEDEAASKILEPIDPEMEILENFSYHRRLLMYKGELEPEDLLNMEDASALDVATQGYGVGNWYLYNGEREKAISIYRKILEGDYWAAFGYVAAEADLARM